MDIKERGLAALFRYLLIFWPGPGPSGTVSVYVDRYAFLTDFTSGQFGLDPQFITS